MHVPSKPPPNHQTTLTPYLSLHNAAEAMEFYKNAFGAKELVCLKEPSGKVAHCEMELDGIVFMLADEYREDSFLSPRTLESSTVALHLYVRNVDEFSTHAAASGARLVTQPEDKFYGDRACKLVDPFGHMWIIATRIEDVSPDEMKRRMSTLMNAQNS